MRILTAAKTAFYTRYFSLSLRPSVLFDNSGHAIISEYVQAPSQRNVRLLWLLMDIVIAIAITIRVASTSVFIHRKYFPQIRWPPFLQQHQTPASLEKKHVTNPTLV